MKAESGNGRPNGGRFLIPDMVFIVAGHRQRAFCVIRGALPGYGDLGSADQLWDQQTHDWFKLGALEEALRGLPCWSVVKTPHFQGSGFALLLGN